MKRIVFTLVFVVQSSVSFSCSCYGPHTFLKSITHLTVEVELLGAQNYCYQEYGGGHEYDQTFQLIKVLKVYTDRVGKDFPDRAVQVLDTLLFIEGNGTNCKNYLPNRVVGSRFILALEAELQEFPGAAGPHIEGSSNLIVHTFLCAEAAVLVEGAEVIGNISSNYLHDKRAFLRSYSFYASHCQDQMFSYDRGTWGRKWWSFWSEYWASRSSRICSRYKPFQSKVQRWSREKFDKKMASVISA